MSNTTLEAWWPVFAGLVSIQLSLVVATWRISRWVAGITGRLESLERWRADLSQPRPLSPAHKRDRWR